MIKNGQGTTGWLDVTAHQNCFKMMFHGRKTNLFKKSPRLFGFQRSQIESQLNGADG